MFNTNFMTFRAVVRLPKIATIFLVGLCILGCGGADTEAPIAAATCDARVKPASFEDFERCTYKESGTGFWIVDGDTPIIQRDELVKFYEDHVSKSASRSGNDVSFFKSPETESTRATKLAVHRVGGVDAAWSPVQRQNLTFCISNSFGARKQQVVDAMNAAALDWESAANVNFIYVPSQDFNCTSANTNVVFDVTPVSSGGQYLMRAFYPSYPRSARSVLIDDSAFLPGPWPLRSIARHNLGHALGFRHEHTRPQAGTCFEDNSWRSLTVYDRASVMHYPQCNGISAGDPFALTPLDVAGAQSLYGAPFNPPPPPPPGVDRTQNWSGSLIQNQSLVVQLFPSLPVVAGSTLSINMNGTGDPDLYVRFGSAPTVSFFSCRSWSSSSSESCILTVPSGTSTAFVGVVGYTASTYNITANYRSPN